MSDFTEPGGDPLNAEGSLDGSSIQQIGDAAKRLRSTATWTVGAVAVVGSALGAAIGFNGLADLHGGWFWLGAAGLVAVVVAGLRIIAAVASVLAPTDTPLRGADTVVQDKSNPLTDDMLFGACTVAEFADKLEQTEKHLVEVLEREPAPLEPATTAPTQVPPQVPDPPDPVAAMWAYVMALAGAPAAQVATSGAAAPDDAAAAADPELKRARALAELYGGRAERIRLIVHFAGLARRWRDARIAIMFCAVLAAAGVVAFEYASTRQKQDTADAAKREKLAASRAAATAARVAADLPKLRAAPDLIVTFRPGALGTGVEPACAGERRAILVPGQSKGQRGFVLLRSGDCEGRFVRVDARLVKDSTPARVPGANAKAKAKSPG